MLEAIWKKVSWTECHKNTAWLSNFIKKTCTIEAETSQCVAKLGVRFLLVLTKNIHFLERPPLSSMLIFIICGHENYVSVSY